MRELFGYHSRNGRGVMFLRPVFSATVALSSLIGGFAVAAEPAVLVSSDLKASISQAILAGDCEKAKAVAVAAGQFDLAEQALRLCTPRSGPTSRPTAIATTPPAVEQPQVIRANWKQKPTAEQAWAFYPKAGLERGVGGKVVMTCVVLETGRTSNCTVISEDPPGLGFGEAATKIALVSDFTPTLVNGTPIPDTIRFPVNFNPPPKNIIQNLLGVLSGQENASSSRDKLGQSARNQ
ncbi:energy transducer TonB [Phenylobacterium sp.]|uniref:energy transducer TonB n=1 Tax=Phenylobacterium sp. TaxID=1871053 RepID=UPI00396C423A